MKRFFLWLTVFVATTAAVLGLSRALAPPAAAQEDELETFVPSEELPADSSVSFPVDI